jgi:hypothetical protein
MDFTPQLVVNALALHERVEKTKHFRKSSPARYNVTSYDTKHKVGMFAIRGRLHGAFSTPGLRLSPVNRVEIFCDYMDDFNPGVETLYYTFSASIRGSKKSLYFVFL